MLDDESTMSCGTTRLLFLAVLVSWSSMQWSCAQERPREFSVESMTTALILDARIPAQESGILTGRISKPGESVSAGAEIGSLDSDRQQLAVEAAELALQIATLKAEDQLPLQTAAAQVREAEQLQKQREIAASISRLEAESDVSVRLAEKTREVAQFELDRARKAREAFAGAVSNAELNRLQVLFDQKTLEIEKAREDRAVAALQPDADAASVAGQMETVARARLLVEQQSRSLQMARVEQRVAESELSVARLQLSRRRLLAPFDGIIVEALRQPGEWVEAGTDVFRIIQLDRMRVEGFVDADLAAELKAGRAVRIQIAALREQTAVSGVLTFVSPEVDPVNHQVRIEAEFANPDHRIRPGLTASLIVTAIDR